jgi:xylan 1,4-beta-xylosidase
MGIANQLRNMDSAFRIIASFPELKSKPIVIGESDPTAVRPVRATSWVIATARFTPVTLPRRSLRELDLADRDGVNLEGALTWAFEFEEPAAFRGFSCAGQRRY